MRKTAIFTIVILLAAAGGVYIYNQNMEPQISGYLELEQSSGSLTILYDNYQYDTDGRAEWGFSCLVETPDKVVLFDTGGEIDILRHNIEAFDVDLSTIDCVVISHEHWDHIGGLEILQSLTPGIPVYVPDGTPYSVKSTIRSLGGECIEAVNATKISDSIAITSTLDGPPREQSLIIRTEEGVILVTGCSHPGVNNLARDAHNIAEKSIRLVIGGFHLGGANESTLDGICDELDEIGVEKVSATHCTGDEAREYFRERYGDNFVESGVGFHMEF